MDNVSEEDAPGFEDALELCASEQREKKLVGCFLAARALASGERGDDARDAVARALGATFLDSLIRPSVDAGEGGLEDAAMACELGLSACEALARSTKFAGSKTMGFWITAFERAAMREGVYEKLSDDAVASALMCAFQHAMCASGEEAPREPRAETVKAAVEALRRSRGESEGTLNGTVIHILSVALQFGSRVSEDAVIVARAVPEICRVLRNSSGSSTQLQALFIVFKTLEETVGMTDPDSFRQFDVKYPRWRTDLLEGLWVVLSSRTPRTDRFLALIVCQYMSDGSIPIDSTLSSNIIWLAAAEAKPPPAVLAGAVSGGSTKKVPSFLCLITEIVRVEINVGLYALLNAAEEPKEKDDKEAARNRGLEKETNRMGLFSALELFPRLVEAAGEIAALEEDGKFELSEGMGRLSLIELEKVVKTLADISSSMLEVFEDDLDPEKVDKSVLILLLQCVVAHLSEAPELHRNRVEKLLPYWCGEFVNKSSNVERERLSYEVGAQFLMWFSFVTNSKWGVDLIWECGYVKHLAKYVSSMSLNGTAQAAGMLDISLGYVKQIRSNVDEFGEGDIAVTEPLSRALDEILASTQSMDELASELDGASL